MTYLEASNFFLDVVRDVTEASTVRGVERAQFALKGSLIQNFTDAHTAARGLVTVARTNTLASGANLTATKTSLLQTIDNRVQVKADMCAVRNKDATTGGSQTLGLKLSEFLEEAGDVDDGSGTNQVDT